MNFESRITRESQVYPGVRFTLNRMTEGRRIKLRLATAKYQDELRTLLQRKEAEQDGSAAIQIASDILEYVANHIDPAWMRWGLHSIDGLEIDGSPATVESLIEDGPPELYRETLAAIREAAGLSGGQEKNSESPTTSGAPADGRMKDTTVGCVENADSSVAAIVASTSPSA